MSTTPADPATTAARLAPALPQAKFGLLRPFSTDRARDLTRAAGDDLLASRVGQVVSSDGSFPWRPELTANLDRVRNIKDDQALQEFARVYVGHALSSYLPEVVALAVSATRGARRIELTVTCTRASDIGARPPRTFSARAALSA